MSAFCQIPDNIINKKLSIELCFSLEYCYRKIVAGTSNLYGLIKELIDSVEIAKFGFTTGLSFMYRLVSALISKLDFSIQTKGKYKTLNNTI